MDRLEKIIEIMKNEFNANCGEHGCVGCKYYDVACSLDYLMDALMDWNKIIPKEPYIQLNNIDLTGYTLEEEKAKLLEEINELIKITIDADDNNSFEHFCEETFDILQVCIGIAEKKYKKSADDLMKEYSKHLLKMEQRGNKPREGRK